ncbi:hypothetical protein [Alteromonas facilis]|uniref:hypothetical protein n=1 Tax=Alteromonas facilis TaxID=2048004 RepID=UPI000C282F05|nr:hypothetical protein [Alteromonas facilis]
MPLPLLWIGAGAAALYAGTKLTREMQVSKGHINHFPGECAQLVTPQNGAVVCCGIYEVFQHTGIWVDNQIVELRGNGLIRAISPERFLHDRSGNRIYVACDHSRSALSSDVVAKRAIDRVFDYSEYDLIENNCHRFTHHCVSGRDEPVTRFAELNEKLCELYGTTLYWQPADI